MKRKGSYEYGEEAEKMLYEILSNNEETVAQVTRKMQQTYNLTIHNYTVERLLQQLAERRLAVGRRMGRFKLWRRT